MEQRALQFGHFVWIWLWCDFKMSSEFSVHKTHQFQKRLPKLEVEWSTVCSFYDTVVYCTVYNRCSTVTSLLLNGSIFCALNQSLAKMINKSLFIYNLTHLPQRYTQQTPNMKVFKFCNVYELKVNVEALKLIMKIPYC